uniref:Protein lin-10 n=2 Tax=Clastoptera arizonana TaxID=38151 RepID=A0A1B6C7Z7_9HEMI
MTSVGLKLDNLANTEQITKLFPKCRPRDINLNPITDNHDIIVMEQERSECEQGDAECEVGQGEGEDSCSQDETSPEESNEEEEEEISVPNGQDNKVILQLSGSSNKPTTYKLRDSRIIEIAGGREVFCQSRSKALRKSRSEDKMASNRRKSKSPAHPGGVWELRARTGESKKNQSSREVTETVFSTEIRSVRHQRVPSNKGAVVFDDIDEGWRGLRLARVGGTNLGGGLSSGGSTPSPPGGGVYHSQHPPAHFFKVSNSVSDGESISPEREREGSKVARVIGSLPIAEYEGSPRRYGPRQSENPVLPSAHSLLASPSVYIPRPGFPQRVVPSNGDDSESGLTEHRSSSPTPTPPNSASATHSTFDYLYEFSETRKVLEEFFKPSDKQLTQQPFQSSCGGSTEDLETEVGGQAVGHSRNFTLSPETTDCDSNCDSEASSLLAVDPPPQPARPGPPGQNLYSSMPVLEDGLSSGHTSDTDNNNPTVLLMKRQITEIEREIVERSNRQSVTVNGTDEKVEVKKTTPPIIDPADIDLESLDPLSGACERTPPPPAPQPHRRLSAEAQVESPSVEAALKDIRLTLQRTKTLPLRSPPTETPPVEIHSSPIWIPRRRGTGGASEQSGEEDEADTDLETDRLLGQQRTDDNGFYEEKGWRKAKGRSAMPTTVNNNSGNGNHKMCPSPPKPSSPQSPGIEIDQTVTSALSPVLASTPPVPISIPTSTSPLSNDISTNENGKTKKEKEGGKKKGRNKEVMIHEPAVLIEGVLFRARYLGSTQLVCEGQPTKSTRMMQAEEAVSRIKALAPEGETQPSTEVDLFISTEKIMVLNTDLKEIMMDHALRTISYIADIGDLVVLMARRRFVPHEVDDPPKINRTPKMICHVFESEEAQFIAQSIGQAFQVAYMEFLKANGIEDHSFVKEMDYQEVLNSQEIFGDELQMFAKKEMQKEVVVPKAKGEILGVVIVESGWGSMLPTVVIANLAPAGAAARCGQLNIGDQIIAINGVSLVGLPLSTCQNYIKNSKTQTVVKLTVVPCAPVVEVKIKRPDTKYQLGFSVQNGVICSLLRGGIAERGGVRVGHRIIEINNQSVVAVPHEKIVNLLATSVGEILMKTMPTSMFRLLTGQETPVYI